MTVNFGQWLVERRGRVEEKEGKKGEEMLVKAEIIRGGGDLPIKHTHILFSVLCSSFSAISHRLRSVWCISDDFQRVIKHQSTKNGVKPSRTKIVQPSASITWKLGHCDRDPFASTSVD